MDTTNTTNAVGAKQPYIEQNCTFAHEGREFSSGGAVVTPDYLIAYPAKDGVLSDWHGNKLGTWSVVSSREAIFFGQRSWQGDHYYYMRGRVNGRNYVLRGLRGWIKSTGGVEVGSSFVKCDNTGAIAL